MHMKIVDITPVDIYTIHVVFDDGIAWDIDLTPSHDASVFLQLSEDNLWQHPRINETGSTIIRNETLDIDAISCYIRLTGINPFVS